jgi:hypothetical protein
MKNVQAVRQDSVVDDFGDDHYDLLVNGERFPIYGRPDETCWSVALKRTLEIENDLLQRAESNERLFAVYASNDARAIVLTEKMREHMGGLPWIDRRWVPYPLSRIAFKESRAGGGFIRSFLRLLRRHIES